MTNGENKGIFSCFFDCYFERQWTLQPGVRTKKILLKRMIRVVLISSALECLD